MKEFNEEGIEKLTDLFDDNIDKLIDRFDALKDAGSAYNTFAGLADGMDGSVKFIIRNDSISADSSK